MKTNDSQTVRLTGATGGTFTLTFGGQATSRSPPASAARTSRLLKR
jgi:hypothetical protein